MRYFIACILFSSFYLADAQIKERFSDDDSTSVQIDPDFTPQRSQLIKATPKKEKFSDKLRFGGFANAGFSNIGGFVMLSPRVFYLATPKLWLGTGGTFIYFNDRRFATPYNEQVVWGLNFTTMYQLVETPLGNLFVQGEYEPLNFERITFNQNLEAVSERVWAHGVFVGGGLMQSMGRGGLFISVLYNLTYIDDDRSYYNNPWVFRIGVAF